MSDTGQILSTWPDTQFSANGHCCIILCAVTVKFVDDSPFNEDGGWVPPRLSSTARRALTTAD